MTKCAHCGKSDFRYHKEFVGNVPENEHVSYVVWICNNCDKSKIETIQGKYSHAKQNMEIEN